jgi:hypothetical protein
MTTATSPRDTALPLADHQAAAQAALDAGLAEAAAGRRGEAIRHCHAALRLDPRLSAAREALRPLGYVTGQMTVDIFEAPIVAQSCYVLEPIRQIAAEHGDVDVLTVDEFYGSAPRELHYFANNGAGVFTDVTALRLRPGWGHQSPAKAPA